MCTYFIAWSDSVSSIKFMDRGTKVLISTERFIIKDKNFW